MVGFRVNHRSYFLWSPVRATGCRGVVALTSSIPKPASPAPCPRPHDPVMRNPKPCHIQRGKETIAVSHSWKTGPRWRRAQAYDTL